MINDPRLERYLTSLEGALKPFPVSDRAEIITEIKSHIFSALERDPNTNLDTILKSLGEPETVANRYLLERGLQPAKTSIHPILKWLVIGFLGTLAILTIAVVSVVNHAGSLLQVDEDKGRVKIFGGLIDVDGQKERVSVHGIAGNSSAFAGAELLNGKTVSVKFNSGKFEVKTSDNGKFDWGCKADGIPSQTLQQSAAGASFDLSQAEAVKCEFAVPQGVTLNLSGNEGKIEFQEPRFNVDAALNVGKVIFKSDAKAAYKFDVAVEEGKLSHFESSKDPDAYMIKIHLKTGKLGNDD